MGTWYLFSRDFSLYTPTHVPKPSTILFEPFLLHNMKIFLTSQCFIFYYFTHLGNIPYHILGHQSHRGNIFSH